MGDVKSIGELPGGTIKVTRGEDDKIILSFIGKDGRFHWFAFSNDTDVRRLAQRLEAVATRAVDHA